MINKSECEMNIMRRDVCVKFREMSHESVIICQVTTGLPVDVSRVSQWYDLRSHIFQTANNNHKGAHVYTCTRVNVC